MKQSRWYLLVLASVAALAAIMMAQEAKPVLSPAGEASVKFEDGKTVTIKYSRPSMRARKVYGELVPYGQIWRTGANAATTLTTDANLDIGGTAVPAGAYTLYTVPGQNQWQLVVNKQTGQWGTKYDQGQDFARIPMKVAQLQSGLETFTISFDKTGARSATLTLDWENTTASVNVSEK